MSRAERVVKRVVEETVRIERCDQCGAEADYEENRAAPSTWFVLWTPESRARATQGQAGGLSFCSAFCLAKFARGLCEVASVPEVGLD